jgi:hypothetical protein
LSDLGPDRAEIVRDESARRSPAARAWYLLLLVPFIGLLWVPFYADDTPELFGFPFFYWYQFAWVPVTAVITWIVFRMVR